MKSKMTERRSLRAIASITDEVLSFGMKSCAEKGRSRLTCQFGGGRVRLGTRTVRWPWKRCWFVLFLESGRCTERFRACLPDFIKRNPICAGRRLLLLVFPRSQARASTIVGTVRAGIPSGRRGREDEERWRARGSRGTRRRGRTKNRWTRERCRSCSGCLRARTTVYNVPGFIFTMLIWWVLGDKEGLDFCYLRAIFLLRFYPFMEPTEPDSPYTKCVHKKIEKTVRIELSRKQRREP